MRLTPRTIMGQLITGTVIVQLLVFTVFLAISVRHEFHHTQQRDEDRLRKQTGIIANLVAEPLTKDDPDLMDHVMHAVPIAASVKGARLSDTTGQILRNTSNDLPMVLTKQERALLPDLAMHPKYRSFITPEGDLEGVQPVLADGLVRGIVWVTQDTALALTTPTTVLESLLIYSPFALVGNLLLVWALSGSLARPLRRLRKASQQVQLDPNDLSAFPLPAEENNEAAELTASVNAMVNEIAVQRQGTHDTLNLLDSMLTGAPIGFGFYDREYRYMRVNEHLAEMHGVLPGDHIGRRLRDLLPPSGAGLASQVEKLIQQVFDTEKPIPESEINGYLSSDEEESTFQTSYFPVFAGGEVRWVGVIATDITERRRAEEALRRNEKQTAAGRLAASIAHDISNPLESITNLLYLLRQNTSLDAEANEYIGMAQGQIARVNEITQETLSFYQKSKVATEVNIGAVLRAVVSLQSSRMLKSNIEVDFRVDDEAAIFGYPSELRQLFANLTGTSIDAMPYGGRLQLRVKRGRRDGIPGLYVAVAHNGAGMSAAMLKQIFEPGMSRDTNGGGPGLWMSDEIVGKHHGVIRVRSRLPRLGNNTSGTVFRLFFPLRGVQRGPFIVHSSTPVLAVRG
jgi:PAS domain S-box-containing protein